jgi:hypothetical protein
MERIGVKYFIDLLTVDFLAGDIDLATVADGFDVLLACADHGWSL